MVLLPQQLFEQGGHGMQKVRLQTLTESVQPAPYGRAGHPGPQDDSLLPGSYPGSAAPPTTYFDQPLLPSANLKNASGSSSPSPSILVIDDSPTTRKIIETALHREGYLTITFPDGLSAFRWLAQASASVPRLVLLAIILPKMDGYAIARALKAKPAWESMC